MTDQLALEVEQPLRFIVRRWEGSFETGTILDEFTEADLACVAAGHPGKALHEAFCWAYLAVQADKRARQDLTPDT